MVASDIGFNDKNAYEDWWVHPALVNPEILKKMTDVSEGTKFVRNYMFPGA
jgi:hypothetical protein